jgi:hypothetical protein
VALRLWVGHEARRQHNRVVFAPGKDVSGAYNLWRGFTVVPDCINSEAKCSRYLAHIRKNICQSDAKLYDYIIKWMANAVQNPDRPGGAALVLRGGMGTGKGVFAKHFGRLFGPHYVQVQNPEQVTGRFNAHRAEAIVFFADEAFYAGNRQHEQILKGMVTEEYVLIERKNIDPFGARSCLHLILAGNADWTVPVSHDDRRYCCIDVGVAHQRDNAYFAAIDEQMKAGGYEALLGFLSAVDLTGFYPEQFPRTAEHDRQRARSRRGLDVFIEKICHEGKAPYASGEHPDLMITSGEEQRQGFDYYINHLASSEELRRAGALNVKSTLKKDWGCTRDRESKQPRRWGLRFPPLAELRKMYEAKHGKTEWENNAEEWESDCSGRETQDFLHPAG